MGIGNELFGGIGKLPKSLWDMVSYPFGGGTLKQDQAYYAPAFNQFNPNKDGGYGSTAYGPVLNAPVNAATNKATFNNSVAKPVATAVDKAAGATVKAVGNVANTTTNAVSGVAKSVLSSNTIITYVVLAIGVSFGIKILKKILRLR